MPMTDGQDLLGQNLVDFRNEERRARWECGPDDIDESAGMADLDENTRYGPGNPDWEHDREREERDA